MAKNPIVRKAGRSLLGLTAIAIAISGAITYGVLQSNGTWTPKLALDLQGGTQILLAAQLSDGNPVQPEQLDQAVSIIRQRVDASGVSEAEITTQGTDTISVSIPGKADEETLKRIEASAKLDFRPVITVANHTPQDQAATEPAPGAPATGEQGAEPAATQPEQPVQSEQPQAQQPEVAQPQVTDLIAAPANPGEEKPAGYYPDPLPTDPSAKEWLTPAIQAELDSFDCRSASALDARNADPEKPLITCDQYGAGKYLLGPVELTGDVITDSKAEPEMTSTGATTGKWVVQMTFDKDGAKKFGDVSSRIQPLEQPRNQFAFVLDGQVLSAPVMNSVILDGRPQISGDFTKDSSKTLADQLKFGALPIGFTVQSQEDISATLGSNQLQAGLLAGLIGLLLVVIYSIFQYRFLAILTISSLTVVAIFTYLLLTFFSWRQGYRLSLAGVAGIIIAVGFTADSFIVYFERVRDSLRDGLTLGAAVEHGWKKALRTVLASDGVNFLAALILYILAVGNVKGFAFTLGLTTVVDVIAVILFTHPMMTLLARTKLFSGGHPWSGLDPNSLGAVYRGRARFREPVLEGKKQQRKTSRSRNESERRQTIAERKAAEATALSKPAEKE